MTSFINILRDEFHRDSTDEFMADIYYSELFAEGLKVLRSNSAGHQELLRELVSIEPYLPKDHKYYSPHNETGQQGSDTVE